MTRAQELYMQHRDRMYIRECQEAAAELRKRIILVTPSPEELEYALAEYRRRIA